VNLPESKQRWFFLGLATLSQISLAVIRMGIPALMPFIKDELKLNRTEVGFLTSVLNIGTASAGIPTGKAVDRFGERVIIGYGSVAGGAVIFGINWVTGFLAFLPLLLVTGFVNATSTPAGGKAVAGWFRGNERGLAMGMRQMGIPLGGAIAALTLPPLALRFGWRLAFVLAGAVAILVGFAALRFYKEPPGENLAGQSAQTKRVSELLRRRDFQALLCFIFIMSGSQWCYLTYLELYLMEDLAFSITVAAGFLALAQISGAAGRIFWGVVSDRFFAARRRPVLLLVGSIATVMNLLTGFLPQAGSVWLVFVVVSLLGFTLQGWNGLSHTLAFELVGTRVAGLAIGIANTTGFLGVICLPPLYGFLVDYSESYRLAWLALAGMILPALAALLWGTENKKV
jgi:sugar phosphate permease